MTNLRDPYSPQATAGYRSGTAVGAVNWSGAAGFVSRTSATSVATGTTSNTGYFFAPAVTQTAVGSGT